MQVCPKREVEKDLSYFEDEPGDDQRPSCSARMRREGIAARAVRRAALGPDWSRKLPQVQCGFGLGIGTAA